MADVGVEGDSCPLDVSLLRGAPMRVLLRRGGDVFKNSEGIAESYGLSSLVIHVDTFTSHTWRTPKTKKFMALSLHFNFAIACVSALFIGLVVSTLGGIRVLPVMELDLGCTDIPETLCLTSCYRLTSCNGNTRKGKGCWVHTTPMHCAPLHTPWFGGYRRHTPFTGDEPKYNSMARRNSLMKSSLATPIPPRG